jgi:CelD/BcsL family acetyltransferase involved in cellulose biosynthesis
MAPILASHGVREDREQMHRDIEKNARRLRSSPGRPDRTRGAAASVAQRAAREGTIATVDRASRVPKPVAAQAGAPIAPRRNAGELITDLRGLEALAGEWDALAVSASKPVTGAGWALAWLRHVASPDVQVRLVAVRDRGRLIGVAPFYLAGARRGPIEYRLMGSACGMRLEPLALPGREFDVAGEVARVLDSCRPSPDALAFGPMAVASHWATALSVRWPGPMRAVVRQYRVVGEPIVLLRRPVSDAWQASLGTRTRRVLRREQRIFEAAGGSMRWSTAETLRADVEAFARLHTARWQARSERSRLATLGPRLPDWLEDLGRGLVEDRRFRMCVLEIGGNPICGNLHLIAGEESAGVNVGWDERYARFAPGKLAMLRAIDDAGAQGCRRVSLGYGEHPYKLIFANGNDPVCWSFVMRPSPRLPQTYLHAMPELVRERARDTAQRWLPPAYSRVLADSYRRLRG